jgi:hypothetical protein
VRNGSGAATGSVSRLNLVLDDGSSNLREVRLVRKTLEPLASGPHAAGAGSESHWAYWRREALAFRSGLLPKGPGLRSPDYLGGSDAQIFLREVTGAPADAQLAAKHLGAWQASTPIPDRSWLARDQLAQRLALSDLDWSAVDADAGWERIWRQRANLLDRTAQVPVTVVHGDFSIGNLRSDGPDTVALDWATFGVGPVGADLVSLTLSSLVDPLASYLEGLAGRFNSAEVESSYHAALLITAASRVHWMLSRGIEPPPEFADIAAKS